VHLLADDLAGDLVEMAVRASLSSSMHRQTVMVRAPTSFVQMTLWPEFLTQKSWLFLVDAVGIQGHLAGCKVGAKDVIGTLYGCCFG